MKTLKILTFALELFNNGHITLCVFKPSVSWTFFAYLQGTMVALFRSELLRLYSTFTDV